MKAIKTFLLILGFCSPILSIAQTDCIEGFAGEYPCDNVDLLAHLTTDELLAEGEGLLINDIWGWTDPTTSKEYVLVGMINGTSFVDISDPLNPVVLGMLPEHHLVQSGRVNGILHGEGKSIWRDIKVYKNHAFIVSEDAGHGMQVFDLTDLRNVSSPPVEFTEAGHYDGISNAHNIVIDEHTGYAYAVGSTGGLNCSSGGLHIIDIQDPVNPVYAGCFDSEGYTHDAQCVTYSGPDTDHSGKEICFSSNARGFEPFVIVDVTDKESPQLISNTPYTGQVYSHQGWLTEDHKYFLSNDELDNYHLEAPEFTKTFIWDVQDLDAPLFLGTFVHSTVSIDHNLYIVDDMVFQSNYTSGLRILDISDIANANLEQLAFFDTYPENDDPHFLGTWSNYPFFDSGVVPVSDFTRGLFLVMPRYDEFILGLNEANPLNDLKVYPIPARDWITIESSQLENYSIFAIHSLGGRVTATGELTPNNRIDVSQLKRGMYLLTIKSERMNPITRRILID